MHYRRIRCGVFYFKMTPKEIYQLAVLLSISFIAVFIIALVVDNLLYQELAERNEQKKKSKNPQPKEEGTEDVIVIKTEDIQNANPKS